MTIRAKWNGTVVAESDDTVIVEGNHYFPSTTCGGVPRPDRHPQHVPVEGLASYYSVVVDGQHNDDAAWYYPSPRPRPRTSAIGLPSGAASRSPLPEPTAHPRDFAPGPRAAMIGGVDRQRMVIVGGGIVGTMHALEATGRGYEVVQLEREVAPRGPRCATSASSG